MLSLAACHARSAMPRRERITAVRMSVFQNALSEEN
jgi:hypothetical protein